MPYSKQQKIKYYQQRLNDQSLTPGQRKYAERKLISLGVNRYNSKDKHDYYSKKYQKQYESNLDQMSKYLLTNEVIPIMEVQYDSDQGFIAKTIEAFHHLRNLFSHKQSKNNLYKEYYYFFRKNGLSHEDASKKAKSRTIRDIDVKYY